MRAHPRRVPDCHATRDEAGRGPFLPAHGPRTSEAAVVTTCIKLLLVPLLLGAVTWANGKVGPRIAGALAALPIVAGPAALAIAIEQGTAFEARAAIGTLAGEFSLGVFCVVYTRLCRSQSWWLSLVSGWLGFGVSALLFATFEPGFPTSLGLALATPPVILWLAPEPKLPSRPRRVPRAELLLRMAMGAAMVMTITSAAHLLGTTWSGLLTIFPIVTSVLAASSQRSSGADPTLHLLRGLGLGLFSLTAFFAVLALGLAHWGMFWAFAAASGAALVGQLLVLGGLAQWTAHTTRASAHEL
jgi:hypothetical protein